MQERRYCARLSRLNISLGLLKTATKMPNAGFGVTAKFEKNFSGLQNYVRRRKASLEAKTTIITVNLAGTQFPEGRCCSRTTHRRLNCCYPICSDTRERYGTILSSGQRGMRITQRVAKAMHLRCPRSFEIGHRMIHWLSCHPHPNKFWLPARKQPQSRACPCNIY